MKRVIWRCASVDVAHDVRLVSSVQIWTSGPVIIGESSFLGHRVMISGGDAPITIGQRCDLAPNVTIVSGSHEHGSKHRAAGKGFSLPIVVEDGVWIGASSTILAGCTIGEGTIIAAGSIVTGSIASGVIAAGVPCKVLKERV